MSSHECSSQTKWWWGKDDRKLKTIIAFLLVLRYSRTPLKSAARERVKIAANALPGELAAAELRADYS